MLGLFVTTHIMYNIILTVTTKIDILYKKEKQTLWNCIIP